MLPTFFYCLFTVPSTVPITVPSKTKNIELFNIKKKLKTRKNPVIIKGN